VPTAQSCATGRAAEIPRSDLVPGDIVLLDAGARVPADGRIIESVQLQVAEAALTGESLAGREDRRPRRPTRTLRSATGVNMAYLGTAVTEGRGSWS
jgi:Ca2+-transporting ATPase